MGDVAFQVKSELQAACNRGDAKAVAALLWAAAVDGSLESELLHTDSHYGLTPLGWAAQTGHQDIAGLLLEHMPERQVLQPGAFGYTPLMAATLRGHTGLCEQLLRFAPEQQVLLTSSQHYAHAMQQLLAGNTPATELPPVDAGVMAVHLAIKDGQTDIVRQLLAHSPEQQLAHQSQHEFSALLIAALHGRVAELRLVLGCAPNPGQLVQQVAEATRLTALMLSASCGCAAAVQLLLQHSPDWQVQQADAAGVNALMHAFIVHKQRDCLEIVSLLLRHSPEVQVQHINRNKQAPLMMAAMKGRAAVVQLLLQHSPDWQVQQVNENFGNALMYALAASKESDCLEVVRLLLRHSPEVQVQQVTARLGNALWVAMRKMWASVVEELLKHCPAQQLAVPCMSGKTPLWFAVTTANVKLLKEMLRHMTDPAVLATGLMGVTTGVATLASVSRGHTCCYQLLLDAGADPTTLTPRQLADFKQARPALQKLVRDACERRRKEQRQTQELQAKAEQVAAALLADEEEDRAKAQAAQAKKDKKKQKKATAKAQKAETGGQEGGSREAGVEDGSVAAAAEGVSNAGPSRSSGGAAASTGAGSGKRSGGDKDSVGGVSSGANGNVSALMETVAGADARSLPLATQPVSSSNAECDRWCVVCLERHSCQALVPCGHIVMCGPCCEAVQAARNECPMCREGILAVLAINTANL